MKRKRLLLSVGLLAAFILWTLLVCFADVQPIGPEGSSVGLATINQFVHQLTGVHFALYTLTDWLGLVPIGVCIGFGILGLKQWLQRQSLRKVDRSLLALGLFYIVVMAVYAFFEVCVSNRRPVLIDGILEASYPSSTTLLVLCVMPTVSMHLSARMKKHTGWIIRLFTAFMVIGRLVSGVHWFSDIVGSLLLSAGLLMLYSTLRHE